jgi:hypothetical protein
MDTYTKQDPNLLNKIRHKKMNDFSKIRKGTNYSAFSRKNLGSIPSKFDNFIFKLPEESKSNLTSIIQPMMKKDENLCFRKDIFKREHNSMKNFGSGNSIELKGNTVKFMVNNTLREGKRNISEFDSNTIDGFKTIYSNTSNSTNHTFCKKDNNNLIKDLKEINKEIITSSDKNDLSEKSKNLSSLFKFDSTNNCKSKSLTNIFTKENRYDNVYYQKQLLSKYYPGPGEYEQNDFIDVFNKKNQFRYNSLFKLKSSFPLIDLKDTTYKVGPGSYLKNTFKQNAIFGTFPKAKKTVGEIIKKDENNDDDSDKEYPELPGAINIRDKDRNSYFFISKKNKEENLEKKYGIGDKDEFEKNKKKKDINQFGEYIGKPRWGTKEQTKDFNNDWIIQNLEKKIIEEKKKGNIIDIYENMNQKDLKDENKVKQDTIYWARMALEQINKGKEEVKKKKCVYTFSKIPKLKSEEKHVPGPGYYEPDKILKAIQKKKEFNFNMEMNWI